MCRWVAYLGGPIAPRELLYDPERSLIEQSRRHAPNMEIPNGDGTGLRLSGEFRASCVTNVSLSGNPIRPSSPVWPICITCNRRRISNGHPR